MSPWAAGFVAGAAWLCALAGWALFRGTPWWLRAVAALGLAGFVGFGVALFRPTPADAELDQPLPERARRDGYASSDTCRSCHPGQHASWHRSFHRTMTQVATPQAVVARFDGAVREERGRAFRFVERGGRFYVGEVTPPAPADGEGFWARARRVVMTTGSHHMQAYWVEAGDGELEQVPFVYLIREERWLANSDSFLEPPPAPDAPLVRYTWSDSCITCHSTGGPFEASEGYADPTPEEAVTELGISCEACHGPGAAHVEANRNPGRRYASRARAEGDDTIVNPAALPHDRSAAVCGRCHSVHPDGEGARVHAFRPGDRLEDYLSIEAMFAMTDAASDVADVEWLAFDDRDTVGSFWRDGACRVAGREHSSMIRSGCYLRGEMDCTSCHSMHRSDPDRQLSSTDRTDDAMCTGCHAEIAAAPSAHTHHASNSEGSRCVSCHMPYTAYGLLMATRSHRMDGPQATGDEGRERPNACNLCHMDQTFGWTAEHLASWYGRPQPTGHDDVPAGVHWMLRGDATQRVLAAWHMGWAPAREAVDADALRPALESLLEDPYAAVRQVAATSLERLDPGVSLDLDAVARDARRQPTGEPGFEALRLARDDTACAIPE